MKKISYYLVAVSFLGITFFSSCSLDEEAKAIAAETFYNTKDECSSAVVAPIAKLKSAYSRNMHAMLEAYSDLIYGRGTYANNSLYQGENTNDISRTNALWSNYYGAIRDCNIAIHNIPNSTQLTDAEKAGYIGELRFFRAFAYYQIVRLWGDAPLRTDENMDKWNVGKSSVTDIYNFIVGDLQYAAQNAPSKPRVVGLPDLNMAKSLLAEVYLTTKDYASAKKYAGEVIQSGVYELVPISKVRDFDNLFGADISGTKEEIFYLKTSRTNNSGWEYVMFVSHPKANIDGQKMHGAGGYYGMYTLVNNSAIAAWDNSDLRKKLNVLPFDYGEGSNTALLCKFYDPKAASTGGANVNIPLIRYADVLLTYAEAATKADGAPSADTMEKLNMIHRRAYGYPAKSISSVDFKLSDYSTIDEFMELLIKEEGYETFNEGKRWFFLKRLGIAKSKIKEVKGIDVADKHMLWMIPETEFNTNKALSAEKDQNPGY